MRQFLIVHMGYIICLCIIWHHITQNVYGLADSGFATCVPKSQKIIYCDTNEYNFLIVCAIVTGSGISIAGGGGGLFQVTPRLTRIIYIHSHCYGLAIASLGLTHATKQHMHIQQNMSHLNATLSKSFV